MGQILKIKLEINGDDYKFMANTLMSHKKLIYQLGVSETLKKDLIRDIHIITNIIEKSEIKTPELKTEEVTNG